MKVHSIDYKNNINKLGRELDSKITYELDGQTIELGSSELNSITPSYKGALLKSVMKELEIDSNVEIPLGTILTYEFGLKVNGTFEYLNFGHYVVNKVEKQEDTRSWIITCYDKMLYSMVDYEDLGVTYPITIREYIIALCNKLGLDFANSEDEFCNYDKIIYDELFIGSDGTSLGFTYRDVLDQIAEVTGSIVCINNDDELELRYLNEVVPTPTRPSKNLVDTQGFQNGYINTSGSFVSDNKTALLNYKIPVEAGKTYCVSTNSNVDNMVISMFGSNDNFLRRQKVSNTNKVVQLMANDVSYMRYAVNYNNSTTMTQEIIDNLEIMCEESSDRTTPYEPFGPVTMGKNLLNINDGYDIGYIDDEDYLIQDDGAVTFKQKIPVEGGVRYCISLNQQVQEIHMNAYNENDELNVVTIGYDRQSYSRLIPASGTSYITISIIVDDLTPVEITDELLNSLEIMVESGTSTRTSPYEPYVEPPTELDTIDEEYLKDINVKFGEKFGPINTIVLSRAGDSDRIYKSYPEDLPDDEKIEIKISENQFMNFNDRDQYLNDLLDTLKGIEFYINDYSSTGITYYDLGDYYNVKIGENTYKCLMLNDTIEIGQGLSEDINCDRPDKEVTDYKKVDKTDRRINQAYIIVDKQNQQIEALTSQVTTIENTVGDSYTKEEVNQLIQTANEGITNNFINSGGNNLLRNTGLWFEDRSEIEYMYPHSTLYPSNDLYMSADPHWEYWKGNAKKVKEDKAANMSGILLQTGYLEQQQQVRNGTYTLSFKYRKLVELATINVQINDRYIDLTSVEDTEIIEVGEITAQSISIKIFSDTDDSCVIYDLMLNAGSEKAEYSQHQNETTTDTVNISKGITIQSSDTNTTFKANSDGIRVYNSRDMDTPITEYTDTGMDTNRIKVKDEAEIIQVLWKNVGNNTWISRL